MAKKQRLSCNECDFEYFYVSGGAKSGSLSTYFCFDCLKPTMHFSSYNKDIPYLPPRYLSYLLVMGNRIKNDLKEEESKKLLKEIYSRYDPELDNEVISKNELEAKYLDLINEDYNKAKDEYIKSYLIQKNKSHDPSCVHCESKNVFEQTSIDCPLCGSKRAKTNEIILID